MKHIGSMGKTGRRYALSYLLFFFGPFSSLQVWVGKPKFWRIILVLIFFFLANLISIVIVHPLPSSPT